MNKIRHTILGLFLFASLGLLGVATIALGDFDLRGSSREYTFHFENVEGLEPGNPVTVYGVQLGRVESIRFTDDTATHKRLAVVVRMDRELLLNHGARVSISPQSLLGGKRMEIETGDPDAPRVSTESIHCSTTNGIDRAIGILLEENRDDLRRILGSIATISESVANGDSSLLRYLLDEQSGADLSSSIALLRRLGETLLEGDGSLPMLIRDPSVYQNLAATLERSNQLLSAALEGDGNIARLLREDGLYRDAEQALATFAELAQRTRDGEGLIGKAFSVESEQLLTDLSATLANARTMSDGLVAGEGMLGLLLRDPELRRRAELVVINIESVSSTFADVATNLREGRGALGYLLTDEEAARSLRRLVALATGAIEDARESAPVSTFASFLFGQQ